MENSLKLALAAVFGAALAGCASLDPASYGPTAQELTNLVGGRFAGRPVQEMTGRYGAPLRQQQVAGETVFSWERSRTMTFSSQPPAFVRCQLDAYVRPDGIVRTIGFSGQLGGCDAFAP